MIANIIRWSVNNRFTVLLMTAILTVGGIYSISQTPIDAIPDLSDVQVIIKTSYPGQAPQVVEDQVTYPLTTAMLAVPGANKVRGYSFFGDSYVYIIFDDGVDLTGRGPGYSNISARSRLPCQKVRGRRWGRMRPASAGYSSTHWSTAAASMIFPS